MIISEKQIMLLLNAAHSHMKLIDDLVSRKSIPPECMDILERLDKLVHEITDQQSEELKAME